VYLKVLGTCGRCYVTHVQWYMVDVSKMAN